MRVVSGGQTGVDRSALLAARALGLPTGGWCPRGGAAEDGDVRGAFPELRETPSADPAQRTRRNVRDADATLVLRAGDARSPGTDLTVAVAQELGRPLLVVGVDDMPEAAEQVRAWLRDQRPATLNVAGPRESEAPGVGAAARALLERALRG